MIYENADEVMKELFQTLLSMHQIELEISIRGSDCIFDCVHLLCSFIAFIYYVWLFSFVLQMPKISSDWGGLYIDSPDWIKIKKATVNPISKADKKCF